MMLETLQKFKGTNDNEHDIITLYTQESGSYYRDFNYWLNNSDALAIEKTSLFIAQVIYNLNKYAKDENKGIKGKETTTFYRGIRANLSDLLNYESAKGELICFPSFTSTTPLLEQAKVFANVKDNSQYSTIIIINYTCEKGFLPTAVDVSEISEYKNEKENLFYPYSFFKIIDVQINHLNKSAEIQLEAIRKKTIFEKELKDVTYLAYNEKGNFMEVVKKEVSVN